MLLPIIIMSLRTALTLITQQKFNHESALIEILKTAIKEAKTEERIVFLLECKRAKIIPKFMQNTTKHVRKISDDGRYQKKVDRFSFTALTEAIQDAFRHRAFLWRQKRRLLKEVTDIQHPLVQQTLNEASRLFWTTVEESRRKLRKKYEKLAAYQLKQSECNLDTGRHGGEGPSSTVSDLSPGPRFTNRTYPVVGASL